MTRIIPVSEVSVCENVGMYFTDKDFSGSDVLIAQSETFEQHYEIHSMVSFDFVKSLKRGHKMYILKKKEQ